MGPGVEREVWEIRAVEGSKCLGCTVLSVLSSDRSSKDVGGDWVKPDRK